MTTVRTPLEFVERMSRRECECRPGWWCVGCDAMAILRDIRAQQVRDAARGAQQPCEGWGPRMPAAPVQSPVAPVGGSKTTHTPVRRADSRERPASSAAPVSPGVGPLVEAGQACVDWFNDHGGLDCHLCRPSGGKHDEECPLRVAAHLARTAIVAAVAPVPGPLVGNQQLRADVEHAFHELTTFAPMAFVDAALRTVDAHLATRALRPAREVAHEELGESIVCVGDDHSVRCESMVAAIERDRAGRGT